MQNTDKPTTTASAPETRKLERMTADELASLPPMHETTADGRTHYLPPSERRETRKGWDTNKSPFHDHDKRTIPAEKPTAQHSPLRNVFVYLEDGVVQDVTVPAGVKVTVIIQDEIECDEQGRFTYEGKPEVNHADKLAEALRALIQPLGQGEIDACWQYKDAQQALAAYEEARQ